MYVEKKQSLYVYATNFYPLWAGLASHQQADQMVKNLSALEMPHGIAMSETDSGLQWDLPYGWAPANWLAIEGLSSYGYETDARRIGEKFRKMVEENYIREGTIREKYNVITGTTDVVVQNGYSANVAGFGWTNGVYIMLSEMLKVKR